MKNSISLGFVLLVLGGTGCSKSVGHSSAPAARSVSSRDMDMGDYEAESYAEDDMAAVRMEPPTSPTSSERQVRSRGRLFKRRADRSPPKDTMAAPAPMEPPPAPGDSAGGPEATPADERSPEVDDARHIIYTAGMRVSVFNLAESLETAEYLPDRFGGYVQSVTENTIVLRLPTKALRTVMTELDGYGNVEQRWMRSQDVTAEFTDVESRIRALEETQTQLLKLLDKARTVEEALKVRQALDGITSELEVLKGRMRQLENLTTYSTLTLEFYERGPHNPTPSSNDPFPWVDSLGVEDTEWK